MQGVSNAQEKSWKRPLARPKRLARGDRVAIVTPCWGGAGAFPHRYAAGKAYLEQNFGVEAVEMPHALHPAAWIEENPQARADDLHQAFEDLSIRAVIASIGGDDTIRLIPHIDLDVLARHPKILLGYSDVTVLHFGCLKAGIGSFYGPTIMAGFAENGGMHAFTEQSLRQTICEAAPVGDLPRNTEGWTDDYLEWEVPENQNRTRKLKPCRGARIVQGQGKARGPLIGGCAESLELLKGTEWWPPLDVWNEAILFYETSEEGPSPRTVLRWLRNYGVQGILSRIGGVLMGRPGGQVPETTHEAYVEALLQALKEAGAGDIPVMVDMDFGHTDPILTLPFGAEVEIDCDRAAVRVPDAVVAD